MSEEKGFSISSKISFDYFILVTDKSASKKIVKRPLLPIEYHCSIPLSRIDLSMYDLDLFPIGGSTSTSPMDLELTTTGKNAILEFINDFDTYDLCSHVELSSDSTSFKQQAESRNVFVEQENIQGKKYNYNL